MDHVVHHLLNALSFLWIFAVVQDRGVKVAISNVTENTREQTQVVELLLGDLCSNVRSGS